MTSSRAPSGFVVRLMYKTQIDWDYFQRGVVVRYVRIRGTVSFETRNGWTRPMGAIIDTGAPISIIPRSVWEQIRHGFYSNREREVPVGGQAAMGRFGQVTLRFHDVQHPERISSPLALKADLLADDSHPIVLGFESFLTDVELHSNFRQQQVYLVFS